MLKLLTLALMVHATEAQYFVNDKQSTKLQAVIALAQDPSANVVKCQAQELSEKATLRNRKKTK